MVRNKIVLVLLAFITLLTAGCPSLWKTGVVKSDATPSELYQDAEDRFQKKNYTEAVQLYERLKSAYPDFEKIPRVYVRIADSFFHDGKYEEAVSRYRQFLELYPNHEDKNQAKYNIGMCFFNQIKNTDLDDTMVRKAEQAFKEVVDDPDAGQLKAKAEEKYKDCRTKLAEKELYKARTYLTLKKYTAAKMAAQRILDEYPNSGLDKEAKDLISSVKGK